MPLGQRSTFVRLQRRGSSLAATGNVGSSDAADAYSKVPIPPHASLDTMSESEIRRLERAKGEAGNGLSAGNEALDNSPIPSC